ncbi:hypothetical protein PTKIN_Ptkin09bG0252500 [Pterospermum kingtungense]
MLTLSVDNLANVVGQRCDVSNEETKVVSSDTLSLALPVSENTSSCTEDDSLIPIKDINHQLSFRNGSSPVINLSKSSLDYGLLNRQASIVVLHQRTTGFQWQRSTSDQRNSAPSEASAGSNGEYFAYIKCFLSYVNLFSYLRGGTSSSTTAQESRCGVWEYGPNPMLQNNLAGTSRTYSPKTPTASISSVRGDVRDRRPTTSRYGSNIHALIHDEDDGHFADRNPFRNGNSTQYGGNGNSK